MAKKKIEINNPAEQFITGIKAHSTVSEQNTEDDALNVIKSRNKLSESKSKRVQLLIKPSVHQALRERAEQEKTSLNSLINDILEAFLGVE